MSMCVVQLGGNSYCMRSIFGCAKFSRKVTYESSSRVSGAMHQISVHRQPLDASLVEQNVTHDSTGI